MRLKEHLQKNSNASSKNMKKKKKKRSSSILWLLLLAFLGIVVIGLVGACIFGIMFLILDLVQSDNIKKEAHHMMGGSMPNVIGGLATTSVAMIALVVYLSYSLSACNNKQSTINPSWLLCNVHPYLDYHGTQGVKIFFLLFTSMGAAWAIYLHQDPEKITRWKKILLVLFMSPIVILFSIVFLFILSQTPRYYAY